jgi:hypothetical protein
LAALRCIILSRAIVDLELIGSFVKTQRPSEPLLIQLLMHLLTRDLGLIFGRSSLNFNVTTLTQLVSTDTLLVLHFDATNVSLSPHQAYLIWTAHSSFLASPLMSAFYVP